MNIINWIKRKIKKFLEIDILENKVIGHMKETSHLKCRINNIDNKIDYQDYSINKLHTTVENVVHIGTDVHAHPTNYNHSWSVICIEGKMNIVKFMPLGRQDARQILQYLKQFEAGRHCIDAMPPEMFYHELFKFYKEDDRSGR